MANPTCTRDGLVSSKACFSGTRLSKRQKLARRVYFDLLQLAAIGGTNYLEAISTLNTDANSLSCGFKPDDFDGAELAIAQNNASSAGAFLPTTDTALAAAVKCLEDYSDHQLKQMQLLLYCKLGIGKSYPQ